MLAALKDPLVTDVVVFEGGAFQEFLFERGSLLPDDERILAEQWLLIERSLFEVESVQPGRGFSARDLRTGDHLEVSERRATRQIKPGMLLLLHLLPVGDSLQIFGGVELIDMRWRDPLIELLDGDPDPEELVALLARRDAPPTLQNTEGEPLVVCSATFAFESPKSLTDALDTVYERESDELRWIETVDVRDMSQIRAVLQVIDAQLGKRPPKSVNSVGGFG